MRQKVKIFVSYAHADDYLRKRLDCHLSNLKQQNCIDVWHDCDISAGGNWKHEIDAHLNDAQVILLLISADFMASEYCYSIEMKQALVRHKAGEASVIPIILRPVDWKGAPFSHLQALPVGARPVTDRGWQNQDEAFADIAQSIRRTIEKLDARSSDELLSKSVEKYDPIKPDDSWINPSFSVPPTRTYNKNSSPSKERGVLLYEYNVHASWVVAVAWEPTGTRIASAGGDGTVRIWQAETGESLLTYREHTRLLNKINIQSTIYTVAWAPQGLQVASAGTGANVRVWNAETGQTLTLYQGHSGLDPAVYTVVWSPDGKQIASACSGIGLDKTVHIWDQITGQTLSRYHIRAGWEINFSVLSVAWSPDGKHLAATCGDKTIRVWDIATGHLVSTYPFRLGWASHVIWSPNSRYLASAHSDHTVCIWDTFTRTSVMIYRGHTNTVRSVAWSSNGIAIATASNDRTVQIWEAVTGRQIYTYRGHSDWTTSVAWSPDSTRIASASNDKKVHIWQTGDNE